MTNNTTFDGKKYEPDSFRFYPLLFEPNLHPVVWGGNQLRPYKGLINNDEPIGESWEVSVIPSSVSVISNGIWKGKDLISVIDQYPESILGKQVNEKYNGKLPLLVKFIDAKQDLSIQVHPNDDFAQNEHGTSGKSEMWYVLKADQGSRLYAGFKRTVSSEELKYRIKNGTLTEVLAEHIVKAGDVFYIPAGRVHSICGGVMLVEVQQSSDITYRLFDYNRMGIDGKPRPLHIDLGVRAIDYHVEKNYRSDYRECMNRAVQIVESPYFAVRVMEISKPFHRNLMKYSSFIISVCIEGDCKIHVRKTDDVILLREGCSVLIPAIIADYDVIPVNGKSRLLDTFIDNNERNVLDKAVRFFHRTKYNTELK